jgi:23S rRNA (cytidine1920-2'-O)/16S rRNA (cytidine1409-2'-O)-methyltransferase
VPSGPRRPLDQVLVTRGLADDLEVARALIADGRVLVGGAVALHAARGVTAAEPIVVSQPARFVGRGGDKLDAALERFAIDVRGLDALDAGASTGGFTDCLLQRGARRVLAVDVGHDQLHERLWADDRVVVAERTNVRDLTADVVSRALGGPAAVVTVDLSFTSVTEHVRSLTGLAAAGAELVVLVKPQFEVDRRTASRGRGIVTSPAAWRDVLERAASALEAAGAGIMGAMASPLRGASGNAEFFVWARRGAAPDREARAVALDAAVASLAAP